MPKINLKFDKVRITLWQRIFIYTIGVLLISQALAFFLYQTLYHGDMRRYFATTVSTIAADLDGQSLEMVLTHARIYGSGQQRIWLTHADGSAIAGMDFTEASVLRSKVLDKKRLDDVVFLEVDKNPKFWIKAPLHLHDGDYWLFMSFGPPSSPAKNAFLFQLFAPILLTSIVLAFWMAWRVSRPLRKLRDEVREMSQTGPECLVTVAGRDEISEVASAVNTMAESLARHIRGMRALVANISHELRSPLARANLALGIVEESLPPDYVRAPEKLEGDEVSPGYECRRLSAKYLAALQEELSHMETLIGTTLLTQKLEVQQENVVMEPLDFSSLCENLWKRYNSIFQRSFLCPDAAITPDLRLLGNETLLSQLLANLLDNCLKYTAKYGEVRLTLGVRAGKCLLCVENSYEQQVDESHLNHIFDPFYRIDQTTGTGVGLGLSLVQKTVALHGGDIMAVPTDLGICICVQFPLAESGSPGS